MGNYHEFDHVAPINGVRTLFASVEFDVEEPPAEISLGGFLYRLEEKDEDLRDEPASPADGEAVPHA